MTEHAKLTWDHQSGIRERLALLASGGPTLDPANWGYHPSKDIWYYCGNERTRISLEVRQEGSASLDLIAERWNLDRKAAMEWIGYPEAVR